MVAQNSLDFWFLFAVGSNSTQAFVNLDDVRHALHISNNLISAKNVVRFLPTSLQALITRILEIYYASRLTCRFHFCEISVTIYHILIDIIFYFSTS